MSVGQQLIQLRGRRRITQQDLADTAGVSVDLIRKLEQGQRESARLTTINALALALDVPVGDLLGKPRGLTEDVHDGEIHQLRKALLGVLPTVHDPQTLTQLDAAIVRMWNLYYASKLAEVTRELPGALAAAHAALESGTAAERRQANIVIAKILNLAANVLGYIAHEDLAALALAQAETRAGEADDPLTLATIAGSRSWLLTKHAMFDEAVSQAQHAATAIEPRLSTVSPRHIAIWGDLQCYAAFAASRVNAHNEARSFLRLGESAAAHINTRFEDRPEPSNVFGPVLNTAFRVVTEVADEQPREAIIVAEQVGQPDQLPPLLYGRHLVNLAHAQTEDWDNTGAVNSLRQACVLAPELIPHVALAHTLTSELLSRRRKQRLPGIQALADHIGISSE